MAHPPVTLPELLDWLRELPSLDRARLAAILVDARTTVAVAAVRREAVEELAGDVGRAEAARRLGVSPAAIGKAITEHRRARAVSGP